MFRLSTKKGTLKMIEVAKNLFVGNQSDYENFVKFKNDFSVVHACKEPYHRRALGYSGRGAPKNHPEYLIARRGDRLILNLIDVDDPNYIPEEIIFKAVNFIEEELSHSKKVLVHCNQGESRGPGIGIICFARSKALSNSPYNSVRKEFEKVYSMYNPSLGIDRFLELRWGELMKM